MASAESPGCSLLVPMKAFPILLALYTFLAVFLGVQDVVGWQELAALGPAGLAVFALGYCIDLLIFGYLVRGTVRHHRQRSSNSPADSP